MQKLSSSDRAALIRLASALPSGDEIRKAILAGLSMTRKASSARELANLFKRFPGFRVVPVSEIQAAIEKNENLFESYQDMSDAEFEALEEAVMDEVWKKPVWPVKPGMTASRS